MNYYVAFDYYGNVFDGYIQAANIFQAIEKAQKRWGMDKVWRVEIYEGVL
jgi:hypothetical protein